MMRALLIGTLLAYGIACGSSSSPPPADSKPPAVEASSPGSEASAPREAGKATEAATPQAAKLGDPCTKATQCEKTGGGIAVCRESWPGGYCVVEGCTALSHDCPGDPGMGKFAVGGGKCVLAPTPVCLKMCAAAGDCRSGYDCVEKPDGMGHGAVKVCVPK
jgi:hypothetical protein